ncbi:MULTISPECIES: hypothetical protein [unclassified Streptomyces]|uniref:hypothetical protein n=1 Tax=Streptomyces TaxID=1883 RepID=UPI00081F552C|nr:MULTISPECIES: hypothetical protein [unclassified Streptomyces]UCA53487.1 hypothetical protein LEL86_31235 [Streptomyces sp. WA6-1-16]SCF68852.1 hypothetical protein GA0115280_10704 [Streptomyces sp. Cmuel-A718b]
MSQPVQPPNQPQQPFGGQPVEGNPYAGQPGQPAPAAPTGNPYGQQPPAPTGNPFAGQQPGQGAPFGGGAPFAPAPPARNNLLLGVAVALGAAIVAGILYGVIAGSIEREVGYAAVGVGFLVGFAASKVGGSNPAVIAASAVFSIGGVYLGQLIGISMILSDLAQIPFSEVVGDHFDTVTKAWSEEADFMTYLFLGLGAVAAVGGAKKAG